MLNVKLGFDGYNGMKTKKYPKGQPNVLLARSIKRFKHRQKAALRRAGGAENEKAAEETMAKIIDEESAKIMK